VLKLEKMRDGRYCEKQWSGILWPVHPTIRTEQPNKSKEMTLIGKLSN
jgi:hypothetical protein